MKKSLVLAVCFTFAGIVSDIAEADVREHTYIVGSEISYIKYDEPGVMEEEGAMYGIAGSWIYRNHFTNIMIRVDGKGSYGQVDYKNSGTLDNIDDYMLEFRGLGGYDFSILTDATITPYIGVGYRYLNDDSSGMTTTTGALGYERESNYFYSPIGIEFFTEIEYEWSFGITLEYDYFWKGIQKSNLSGVVAGFNDLENDQNKGYGVRGSVKLQKKGENMDFIIEPFIRYWNIKKSEVEPLTFAGTIVNFAFEPKNNSTEVGLKVSGKF